MDIVDPFPSTSQPSTGGIVDPFPKRPVATPDAVASFDAAQAADVRRPTAAAPTSTLGNLARQAKGEAVSGFGQTVQGFADIGSSIARALPEPGDVARSVAASPVSDALASAGQGVRNVAQGADTSGRATAESVSPEFKEATSKGLLDEGGLTPTNIASKAVGTVANMAAPTAAAILNPLVGAATFAAQGESGGRAAGEQQVADLTQEQLAAVPRYNELLQSGMNPDQARARLSEENANRQATVQGAFGGLLGVAGKVPGVGSLADAAASLVVKPVARAVGGTVARPVARAVGAGVGEAAGFAGINAAGTVAGNEANEVPTDALHGVGEALASGLAPGFVLGGAHGVQHELSVRRPSAVPFPTAAPGSVADAANAIHEHGGTAAAAEAAAAETAKPEAATVTRPTAAQPAATEPVAEPPGAAPPPPDVPWVNKDTGEFRKPTDDELKDQFHRMLDSAAAAGAPVSATAASRDLTDWWGVPQRRAIAMRKEAIAERNDGITPENRAEKAQAAQAAQDAQDSQELAKVDAALKQPEVTATEPTKTADQEPSESKPEGAPAAAASETPENVQAAAKPAAAAAPESAPEETPPAPAPAAVTAREESQSPATSTPEPVAETAQLAPDKTPVEIPKIPASQEPSSNPTAETSHEPATNEHPAVAEGGKVGEVVPAAGAVEAEVRAAGVAKPAAAVKTTAGDVTIDRTHDVPLLGGSNGKGVVYLDKHFEPIKTIGGKQVDVTPFLAEHEAVEAKLEREGKSYTDAHAAATTAEHALVKKAGIAPQEYEAALHPDIAAAGKKEAPQVPPDIITKPYEHPHTAAQRKMLGEVEKAPAPGSTASQPAARIRARADAAKQPGLKKTLGMLADAIEKSDLPKLHEIIGNTANKQSRAAFTAETGVKLPRGGKNTRAAIDAWAAQERARAEGKPVEAAALESVAHPENPAPEPTPAQHEANNFKQGHVHLHGLDITIQVPKGGMRRGTDKSGTAWEREASDHYGHIRGTNGGDGEPHDVYLGPHAEDANAKVFVIRQVKPGTDAFDESKAMIGYDSGKAARRSYDANFPKGLKVFGGIKEMSIDEFKASLNGEAKPPVSKLAAAEASGRAAIEQQHAENRAALAREKFKPGDAVKFTNAVGREVEGTITKKRDVTKLSDIGQIVVEHPGRGGVATSTVGASKLTRVERAPEHTEAKQGAAVVDEVEPEKPDTSKRNTEDAGEELWANRRNSTGKGLSWEDAKDLNATLKSREVVKAKVWPRPNYEQLVAEGMPAEVAHVIKQVYDAVAGKPVTRLPSDAHYQSYVEGLHKLRDATFAWARDVVENHSGKLDHLEVKGFEEKPRVHAMLEALFPYSGDYQGRFRGATDASKANNTLANLLGGNKLVHALQPRTDALNEAIRAVAKGWPAPQEMWEKRFEVRQRGDEWQVVGKAGRGFRRVHADGLASKEAAIEKARELAATKKGGDGAKPEPPVKLQNARQGPPRRAANEDVTSDHLKDTFGFRGVNFGNWMKGEGAKNAVERQAHLNHAYDSMMDLAEIMNVPPKALSLNGTLGVAFGAQGTGGKKGAAAHFVPGVNEINLTREHGAGSLAHEWAHAFDHYLAAQAEGKVAIAKNPFLTENTGTKSPTIRPEIVKAFKTIVDTMKTRPETPAERDTRIEKLQSSSQTGLDRDLTTLRTDLDARMKKESNSADVHTEFDSLAARLRAGELGDGYVATGKGRMDAAPQVVGLLHNLYKDAVGAKPAEYVIGRIGHLARTLAALKDMDSSTHQPQQVKSEFLKEANKLEGTRTTPYWASTRELFARAFQSYVLDKLATGEAHNDYLTRPQMSAEKRAELLADPVMAQLIEAGDRYPRGVERERINAAFDTLVGTIEHKETEGGNVAMFRVGDHAATEPTAAEEAHYGKINRAVQDTRKTWGDNAPNVRVVSTAEGLPREAKASKDYDYRKASGFIDRDGTVYVVANKHATADEALRSLAHEVMGHFGVNNIIDQHVPGGWEKLTRDMERLRADQSLGSKAFRDVLNTVERKYTKKDGTKADPTTFAQEALAIAAERGIRNGLIGRAIAAVRAWVRKMFPSLRLSESEMLQLLTHSENFIRARDSEQQRSTSVPAMNFDQAERVGTSGATDKATLADAAREWKENGTDSPYFRRFFGEGATGSKVVDAKGEPLVVHHGTADDFTEFKDAHAGASTGHMTAPLGHFFDEQRSQAKRYAEKASGGVPADERVIDAYLNIRNPKDMTLKQFMAIDGQDEARAIKAKLQEQGFDGIKLNLDGRNQWIAFDSSQIKSTEGRGTFDAGSKNINFALDEAEHERELRSSGIPRAAGDTVARWRNDQPLKADADYKAAKAGDAEAAARLVERHASALAEQAKQRFGSDVTYLAAHAEEASGRNKIPLALAHYLAEHAGGAARDDMIQTNRAYHTGADQMERLIARAEFDGAIEKGRKYVLVDDVTTMGSTFADLAHYIQSKGGEVVGTTTFVNAAREGGKLHAEPALLKQIERRYGDEIRKQFNIDPAALTASEARYLIGFRSADEIGKRAATARRERVERLLSKGIQEVAENPVASSAESSAAPKDTARGNFSLAEPADYSKPSANMATLSEVLSKPDEGTFDRAKAWMRGKAEDFRPAALGWLQRRHLTELMDNHPALKSYGKSYDERVQQLEADRSQMLAGAPDAAEHPTDMLKRGGATIAEDLRKYAFEKGPAGWFGRRNPETKALADVMHVATLHGIDPSEEYSRIQMEDRDGKFVPWTPQTVKERIAALRGQMRGRPGDDKRVMMDEVKSLRNLKYREAARTRAWPDLVAAYQKLSPEAKGLYKQQRDWYAQVRDETEKGLIARVEAFGRDIAAVGGGDEMRRRFLLQTIQRIRLQFEMNRQEGVYFPLNRDGDFWISFADKDGAQGFKMFETAAAAAAAEKKLRASGFRVEAQGRRDGNYRAKNAPTGTFVADVIGILKKAHAPESVQDEIYQTFLRSLPEMSMRKHSIHRKKVPGFSEDILRTFSKNAFHGAHQLARLRHAHELQAILDAAQMSMDNYRRSEDVLGGQSSDSGALDVARGDALLGELKKRHDYMMSPKDTQLANVANSIGFLYHLGASPASALTNLTQNAQVTLPVLGAHHGWLKASRMLGATMRDALRTGGNIDRTLSNPEERRAYNVLRARGDIDKTQTHTLAALAEGNQLQSNPLYARPLAALGYMFHKAEVINREAAGMAAYRLGRSSGKSFEDAVQYASDIINGTHFDYSASNRSRIMQGNAARIALQFKNYSLGMTWMMYRNLYQTFKGETPEIRRVALKTFTGIMGTTALMAGTMGLPMINAIKYTANAAHALFGDDEPFDFDVEYQKWLAENLGEDAAKYVATGAVNQITGANLASRVSLSNLWFQDADRELEGKDAYYAMLESLAGPIGGIAKNLFVGTKMVADGNAERGIETMMPKFAKDAMKALRFAHDGANSLRGDPIVPDVSTPEQFIQGLGFTPTRLAEQQKQNSALENYQSEIQQQRQRLLNAYAMAVRSGDDRDIAMEKIHAFNAQYPEIAIKSESIRQSLRARARYSAEARGGIVLNKKIAARVRDMAGADDYSTPAP